MTYRADRGTVERNECFSRLEYDPQASREPMSRNSNQAPLEHSSGRAPARSGEVAYAWALFGAAALLVYVRLFVGVDFTDESFYVGLPWAFVLGHRPIVDELAVQQFSGIPLIPFVLLYRVVTGGPEGLVLFVRHLYFVGALLSSWLVARYFGRQLGKAIGLLLAAVVIGFVPYGIPSISYNTEAGLGLVSGFLLLASTAHSHRPALSAFLGTLLLLSVGFAYPTLTLVGVIVTVASMIRLRIIRRDVAGRCAFACIAAAALWAAPVAWLVGTYGSPESYSAMYDHHTLLGIQGGGVEKVRFLMGQVVWATWFLVAVGLLVVAVVLVMRSGLPALPATLILAATGPALWLASDLYQPRRAAHATTAFMLAGFAALAVFLLASSGQNERRRSRVEFAGIVSGAVLACACIAWSSANGLRATGAGLLPAALVGLGLLSTVAKPRGVPGGAPFGKFAALLTSLVAFEIFGLYVFVYRDAPITELDTPVEGSVFAGLRTTRERAQFIAELEADLAPQAMQDGTVLFFDYFPAGYLFSELVPVTPSIWMFPLHGFTGNPDIRALYARDLAERESLPDLVVVMKAVRIDRLKTLSTLHDGDVVLELLRRKGYAPVLDRPEYVFLRRGPRALGARASRTPHSM